ncbi:MAG: hypothetical protein OQK09_12270 [Colwellia sp.]|nr:hypothetical protein [Colwellia sp.]MCW9082279.1 hypothetical protein [Colwellia sp.]
MSAELDMSIYEQRNGERTFDEHYNNLQPEQLTTIYSLQKFGYALWFVRCIQEANSLAVLRCNAMNIVCVDKHGKIDKNPNINLR